MELQPTLEDELVLLRPLVEADFEALFKISSEPLLWEQHPAKERGTLEGFTKWFDEAIVYQKALFIVDKSSGVAVGTSRFKPSDIDLSAVEIGWTFLSKAFWGGKYNQAIKKLMIEHAFEHYDRVLFFIDKNNFRSQAAVRKIGGTEISGDGFGPRSVTSLVFCIEKSSYV